MGKFCIALEVRTMHQSQATRKGPHVVWNLEPSHEVPVVSEPRFLLVLLQEGEVFLFFFLTECLCVCVFIERQFCGTMRKLPRHADLK